MSNVNFSTTDERVFLSGLSSLPIITDAAFCALKITRKFPLSQPEYVVTSLQCWELPEAVEENKIRYKEFL
jgi:hypothetical protein